MGISWKSQSTSQRALVKPKQSPKVQQAKTDNITDSGGEKGQEAEWREMVRGMGVEALKNWGALASTRPETTCTFDFGYCPSHPSFLCLFGWNLCPNTLILGGIESAVLGILYTEAWFKSLQLAWLHPFNPATFPADKPYWQRLKRKANLFLAFLPTDTFSSHK